MVESRRPRTRAPASCPAFELRECGEVQSSGPGDALSLQFGRLVAAAFLLLAAVVLVPAGLTWVGVAAILGGIHGSALAPGAHTTSTTATPLGQQGSSRVQTDAISAPGPAVDVGASTRTVWMRGLIAGWADRAPLNQYARSSYQTDTGWL